MALLSSLVMFFNFNSKLSFSTSCFFKLLNSSGVLMAAIKNIPIVPKAPENVPALDIKPKKIIPETLQIYSKK